MARIQERKAAKDYPNAGIKKGDRYFYVKIKTGPYSSRTIRSLTRPSRSSLTSSDFLGQLYDIQDSGFEGIEDGGGLRDIAETVRNLGQEQQDKLDNMPEGLQQGDTGQMIQERIDGCEAWADDIETAADELETKLEEFDSAVAACQAHLADPPDEDAEDYEEPDLPEGIDELAHVADDGCVSQARQDIIDEKVQEAVDADPGLG